MDDGTSAPMFVQLLLSRHEIVVEDWDMVFHWNAYLRSKLREFGTAREPS